MKDLLQKIASIYGKEIVSGKAVVGYENLNFILKGKKEKYVLKLHENNAYWKEIMAAEAALMLHLQKEPHPGFPRTLATISRAYSTEVDYQGKNYAARLLSFIPGKPWAEIEPPHEWESNLGSLTAEINIRLSDFHSTAIQAKDNEWDLQNFLRNKELLELVKDPVEKKVAHYFINHFRDEVFPQQHLLRKAFIHGDVNDYNTMVDERGISGIIDFGDCGYTPLIYEVAIALAYLMMKRKSPIDSALRFLSAYHSKNPLTEQEIEMLFYAIPARWCTTALHAAKGRIEDPDNEYRSVSEKDAWNLLHFWITQNPIEIKNQFKEACGLTSKKKVVDYEKEKTRRAEYFSNSLSLSYSMPFKMESAAFQYMFGANGERILDGYNNIIQVGHCHPKVVEAGRKQLAKLNTNTRYYYDALHEYAEMLLAKFPARLNRVFFVNSGSAASDLAIRIARTISRRKQIAVMQHGYHGNSQLGIEVSHYKFGGKGGGGASPNISILEMPEPVGELYSKLSTQQADLQYVIRAVEEINKADEPPAAFIFEPIMGCGGQVELNKGFLHPVCDYIRSNGGLIIADEVQTGFGRVGSHFWAHELSDTKPDMVILGKPMGNGHPIGAIVTTTEIAEQFNNGMEFFSSFGGNPVSCEIGKAVLEVIEEEGLQQNSLEVGAYFQECLKKLFDHYQIADVRGKGLFLGVELRGSEKVSRQWALKIKNWLRRQNILIGTDGPNNSVLKIKPPLCFNKSNVSRVVGEIDRIISYESR